MVTTAVAGGTRGIGRAITEAVNRKDNYEVKILSRSANSELESDTGIRILTVDYDDVQTLTTVFEDNKVDTVISTLFVTFDGKPQVNLVQAAEASKHTRREIDDRQMQIGQSKLDGVEALEKTSLEYTLFYGYPRVKSYQRQNINVVDIEHNRAAIPGSGDMPVVFTHTLDIAEFVAASLDLPKWDIESYVIGYTVSWNEFLRIAEEVKGEKFEVTHDSLEFLLPRKITELPFHPSLYSQMPKNQIQALFATFGVWFEKGLFHLQPKKTLNQVFPDIKARTVREVMSAGWSPL